MVLVVMDEESLPSVLCSCASSGMASIFEGLSPDKSLKIFLHK